MIKSMTGYGRAEETIGDFSVMCELRSVNNRFLDTNIRVPRIYGYLEEKIKKQLSKRVSRGKVDIYVTVERINGASSELKIDEALAGQYVNALRKLCELYNLRDDVSAGTISRYSDVFTLTPAPADEDVITDTVSQVFDHALDAFIDMRTVEGEKLRDDLLEKLDNLESIRVKIKDISPLSVKAYNDKLYAKLTEILDETRIDQSRILTEVAIMADKLATDEEITRLASHLSQFKLNLNESKPVGKTLDFLVQEINREINTIGSKCNMLDISKLVIEAKGEVEKIREQIQNIE